MIFVGDSNIHGLKQDVPGLVNAGVTFLTLRGGNLRWLSDSVEWDAEGLRDKKLVVLGIAGNDVSSLHPKRVDNSALASKLAGWTLIDLACLVDLYVAEVVAMIELGKEVMILLPSERDTSRLKGWRNKGKVQETYHDFASRVTERLQDLPGVIGILPLTSFLGPLNQEEFGAPYLADGVHLNKEANTKVAEHLLKEFFGVTWDNLRSHNVPSYDADKPYHDRNLHPKRRDRSEGERYSQSKPSKVVCSRCEQEGHVRGECTVVLDQCKNCGSYGHLDRSCPSLRKQCDRCGAMGHKARDCRTRADARKQRP